MRASALTLLLLLLTSGCSTLADSGGGDVDLPNAGVGPFRELEQGEIGNSRSAPYALRDDAQFHRDVSLIDVDGDPATLDVIAYAARNLFSNDEEPDPSLPPHEIVRFHALDARSFDRQLDVVITPSEMWEGSWVGAPAALREDGAVWLYYAAAAGIGLAIGDDSGTNFTRSGSEPVLSATGGWEQNVAPTSPSVSRLADGRWMMFYEVALPGGSAIGVAASQDGKTWTRVGDGPVLAAGTDAVDAGGAGSPFAMMAESAQGRSIQYLYYGAVDEDGKRSIALAAREGSSGAFSRATAPVFGAANDLAAREPTLLVYADFTLLFATQQAGTSSAQAYPAVAVGLAPATATLPPPEPR